MTTSIGPAARAALGSPDRLGPEHRRDADDVVGAPRPQLDAVEDQAVTCPSRREPVHPHDPPVIHLRHSDRDDEVDRLAGSVDGEAGFVATVSMTAGRPDWS